jgi:hypothetical protein
MTRIFGMTAAALTLAAVVALGGCAGAPAEIARVAQQIQPALVPACDAAMLLAPLAGPAAPFIIAGCGSAEAIDKLAGDPSSTAWVNGIIADVQKQRGA